MSDPSCSLPASDLEAKARDGGMTIMTNAIAELDVRDISQPTRLAEIHASIHALAPGEALVLVGLEVPRSLLDELQRETAGRFEWSLLERGPGEVRVELRRRTSERPRSVTEYLQADHVRLDAIMEEVERLARTASFVEARASFGSFVAGLDWHIDVEEQVVFPAFEELTGTPRGPTTVMRMEHVDIRERMQRATAALGTQSVDAIGNALRELTTLLATHNMKEERMLYPMTDRALGTPTAQEELVQRVERF